MAHLSAVLTGDLIQSTTAPAAQVEETMRLLDQTAALIGDATRFTRFRGDGWQIYLDHAGQCLWACLLITARLKAVNNTLSSRISVGIGTVLGLGPSGLSAASGQAFIASGRGLDEMQGDQLFAINGPKADPLQKALFAFAADRANKWSREQAEAMALALDAHRPNNTQIAARLGITRQAVDARLNAAGKRLLDEADAAFLDRYTERHDV